MTNATERSPLSDDDITKWQKAFYDAALRGSRGDLYLALDARRDFTLEDKIAAAVKITAGTLAVVAILSLAAVTGMFACWLVHLMWTSVGL